MRTYASWSIYIVTTAFFCVVPYRSEGQERYALDCSWDKHIMMCEFQPDSTLTIRGKHPLKLSQRQYDGSPVKEQLQFSASQFIHLDENCQEATVTINCRSENLNSFWLKGTAIDECDNIVAQDSVELSYCDWRTDTMKIYCKDARYLVLHLLVQGDNPFTQKEQSAWFDRVELSVDGQRNISSVPVLHNEIPYESITKLTNNVADAPVPFDKKIIALGETMHGNRTVTQAQIELMKRSVMEGHCKLIVWEYPMPDALYWDLYISGRVSEEKMGAIADFAPPSYYGIFLEFLDWLREYNLSHARKIKIVGNMNLDDFVSGPFFYYLDVFYDESTSEVLLPLMEGVARGVDSKEYIQANELALHAIMGDDNYEQFLYTYSLCNRAPEYQFDWFNNRDWHMARICAHYIDTYLADGESAIIIAHASHISKKYSKELWHLRSMGQYLSELYRDDYYSVTITVGVGEFLSHKIGDDGFVKNYSLGTPRESTLENLCLSLEEGHLWITTPLLLDPVFEYRSIGNAFHSVNETETGNIRERFDGVLFIENSLIVGPLEDIENPQVKLGVDKFVKLSKYREGAQ